MSTAKQNTKNFDDLMARYADGQLSADEVAELEAYLGSDADAKAQFVLYMDLHARLHWNNRAEAEEHELGAGDERTEEPRSQPTSLIPASRRSFTSRHSLLTGIAASLLIVGLGLTAMHLTSMPDVVADSVDARDGSRTAKPQFIAKLTAWDRADWLPGYEMSGQNHNIRAGQRVALLSGLVEITYETGARVLIEGPADFVVGGAKEATEPAEPGTDAQRWSARMKGEGGSPPNGFNAGYLKHGRLVARVDSLEAHGFTIRTPAAAIEDLGTEFGIKVDERGVTDTHVFEGKVAVHPRAGAKEPEKQHLLGAGASVRIELNGELITSISPANFVRAIKPGAQFGGRTIAVAKYEYVGDHSDPQTYAPATGAYPDDDRTKLADGRVGSKFHGDGAWVGWIDPNWQAGDSTKTQPTIDFDLGQVRDVSAVQIAYLTNHFLAVHAPDRAVVSVSIDGDDFEQVAEQTDFDDTWHAAEMDDRLISTPRAIEISLGNRRARYVRLEFYSDEEWTFLSEVRFLAPSAVDK